METSEKYYDIQVRHAGGDGSTRYTSFRTDDLIAGVSAEAIRGRATRVWGGRELDNKTVLTKNAIVIKDIWIDSNRSREGDILDELRKDAAAAENKDLIKNIEAHFLHVQCHGDVWVDDHPDTTLAMRRGARLPDDVEFYQITQKLGSSDEVDTHNAPRGSIILGRDTEQGQVVEDYDDKSHYRIVFVERGHPIGDLTSAGELWFALNGSLRGQSTVL